VAGGGALKLLWEHRCVIFKVFPVETACGEGYIFGNVCHSMAVLNTVLDRYLPWKVVTCANFGCLKNDYHIIELAEYDFSLIFPYFLPSTPHNYNFAMLQFVQVRSQPLISCSN